ncbi:MAG: sugar transferase [Bacteroidales bacterium]|jgi:exopolysaccharide biosynthesis polyprenyl glycosylphosphotransferase|nr:sugar transferase [Bacteroidales bacterium]
MNKKLLTLKYLIFDLFMAVLAWILFFRCDFFYFQFIHEPVFLAGLAIYPLFWMILHSFSGYYNKIYHKSRLKEITLTFTISFIGSILVIFVLLLLKGFHGYSRLFSSFLTLFSLQFSLTYIPRLLITNKIVNKIHSGKIGFNTLIVGSDLIALNTYNAVIQQRESSGNFIIGYVKVNEEEEDVMPDHLTCMGYLSDLPQLVKDQQIEELIIAIRNGKRKYIEKIIMFLNCSDITLKIIPQTEDFLLRAVKASSVLYEPLISISPEFLSPSQMYLKRLFDIVTSFLALILLSPLYLILAIGVKLSSKGPVFYRQERVGLRGKPFNIIKFRSMYTDSEEGGPRLSCKDDERITPFGRFMRRSRLDETPQFYNVLKGEMSLVGPRPERQFFVDQLVARAPYYTLIHNVKPGITSWGQVKFGYAENVDEMLERLRWDLLYIENMSLQMDLKILIYTVLIVLKKKGK